MQLAQRIEPKSIPGAMRRLFASSDIVREQHLIAPHTRHATACGSLPMVVA
jgi:hypothetical protein